MRTTEQATNPSEAEIAELRFSANAEIAAELLDVAGKRALDIGCGEGKFTRALAARGARVVGIDVSDGALAKARDAAAQAGVEVEFRHASAEALPFADASLDVVVFSNSLHHIGDMDGALREAARVLTPAGALYVMEPVAAGRYHEATKLVNDESAVRAKAHAALRRAAEGPFAPVRELAYRVRRRFDRYEDWRDEQMARGAKRQALFAANGEDIRRRFETHARHEDGGLAFDQVFRVDLLRKAT